MVDQDVSLQVIHKSVGGNEDSLAEVAVVGEEVHQVWGILDCAGCVYRKGVSPEVPCWNGDLRGVTHG